MRFCIRVKTTITQGSSGVAVLLMRFGEVRKVSTEDVSVAVLLMRF